MRQLEDEWQQVPEEWLEPRTNGKGKRKAIEMDEESELSELPDEDEHEAKQRFIMMQMDSVQVDGSISNGVEVVLDEELLTPVGQARQGKSHSLSRYQRFRMIRTLSRRKVSNTARQWMRRTLEI